MSKMTFLYADGNERKEVDAPDGLSVLEIAHRNHIDLEGSCGGALACSTCHVVVAAEWFTKLAAAEDNEEDMLDLAFGLTRTSRLGCQIIMNKAADGLVVTLPEQRTAEADRAEQVVRAALAADGDQLDESELQIIESALRALEIARTEMNGNRLQAATDALYVVARDLADRRQDRRATQVVAEL